MWSFPYDMCNTKNAPSKFDYSKKSLIIIRIHSFIHNKNCIVNGALFLAVYNRSNRSYLLIIYSLINIFYEFIPLIDPQTSCALPNRKSFFKLLYNP